MSALSKLVWVIACWLMACGTTSIVSTWRSPEQRGSLSFRSVVVIAAVKSPATRRVMEDQLVKRLNVPAIASYRLASRDSIYEQGPVDGPLRELIRDGRFDGAIVMRLASVDRESSWVPGRWVGPYWGWRGWGMWDPGHYDTDTYVRMETNVYSLPEEQLIWAASSQTVNPANINQLTDETMDAVVSELKKQGLLRGRRPIAAAGVARSLQLPPAGEVGSPRGEIHEAQESDGVGRGGAGGIGAGRLRQGNDPG